MSKTLTPNWIPFLLTLGKTVPPRLRSVLQQFSLLLSSFQFLGTLFHTVFISSSFVTLLILQLPHATNNEGRAKLRVVSSVILQRRQSSFSRLRKLRSYIQYRHRLTGFIIRRSHRHRHLRRSCSRFEDSMLLLDFFPRRNHSLLGLLTSRMHQET